MLQVMQGLLKMERSFYVLLIVVSFGVRIQGDSREFPTSLWCDLKCWTKGGGCIGFKGTCTGVCYCIGVSVRKLSIQNKRISMHMTAILLVYIGGNIADTRRHVT